jgi:hypothetical protein
MSIRKRRPQLSELQIHTPYRVFRKKRDGVVGLDTESLVTGYAFLITDYPMKNSRWIRQPEDVIAFLVNPAYTNSFNTFWNLDFDVTVLMKWLGKEFCKTLVEMGEATYSEVRFTYIPGCTFSVRSGNATNTFFDASKYYMPRALDAASKTYLSESKIHLPSKVFTYEDYDRADLLEYCLDDSRKCGLLTQLLLEDLHDMGFSPSTLVSPGTILEEALMGRTQIYDVTKIPRGALEYAYEAYRGGWMECYKKGHFETLYDYDIGSAYPFQISELPSLEDGEWFYREGPVSPHEFTLGWVKGRVNIKSPRVPSPIFFKGDVNYSAYGPWDTTLFEEEARFVVSSGLGSFKVTDGWYFVGNDRTKRPFRYEMRRLFRQKRASRNSWLPKALSVSCYGKFAQKDEEGHTGNLFNPVYASMITARTRLQIAKYTLMQPNALCLVSTDGVTFDKPLPPACLGRDLGDLQLKFTGEGVIIGTNVYTIKGKYIAGEWRPGRYDWLKKFTDEPDNDVYNLEYFRYTTLAEGVLSDFDKIGVFGSFPYNFHVNYDRKRCYSPFTTGGDLMKGKYESIAWPVEVVQTRTKMWELLPYD